MQYCLCLVVGNWTRSDMTTLQNNILLNVKLPGTLISLLSLKLSDQVMWALLDSDGDFTFHRWFVTARSSACPRKIITLSPFQVPNALLWSVSEYLSPSDLEYIRRVVSCCQEFTSIALKTKYRINAFTEQKILHKKVLWVIVFGISRISPVSLKVSLLFSYSTFFCAWLPPLRRVFHHPGKWKAAINEVPLNCIGILAMNCNASQLFLLINWQILFFKLALSLKAEQSLFSGTILIPYCGNASTESCERENILKGKSGTEAVKSSYKVQTVEVINSFAASAISGCSAKRDTGAGSEVSINNKKREFARDRQFHNLIQKQVGWGNLLDIGCCQKHPCVF